MSVSKPVSLTFSLPSPLQGVLSLQWSGSLSAGYFSGHDAATACLVFVESPYFFFFSEWSEGVLILLAHISTTHCSAWPLEGTAVIWPGAPFGVHRI